MSQLAYPMILPAPTTPGAVPCFSLAPLEGGAPGTRPRRPVWDVRCMRILERACSEDQRSNADVARLIEAETGMRFSESVLARHRAALGYGRSRANDYTAPLRRWQPWQGHLADKS